MSEDKREILLKRAQSDIVSRDTEVEKFRKDLDEHPAYALEWAHKVYTAVARGMVADNIHIYLSNNEDLDELYTYVQREALRRARYPERSTSVCSNLLERDTGSAWAQWAELLDEMKRFGGVL
jgi:hypothetical protein